MSEREIRDEELTPFESDLASVAPRAGGLDPGWGDYLAKEAELLGSRGPEGYPADQACPYCGRRVNGRFRRWAWPAAFSAMTAVAATLLAALLVGQVSNAPAVGQASSLAQTTPPQSSQTGRENIGQAGTPVQRGPDSPANPKPALPVGPDSMFAPLAAVPRHGWRLSGSAAPELQWLAEPIRGPLPPTPKAKSSLAEVAGVPLSYRQLLGQFLGQPEGY